MSLITSNIVQCSRQVARRAAIGRVVSFRHMNLMPTTNSLINNSLINNSHAVRQFSTRRIYDEYRTSQKNPILLIAAALGSLMAWEYYCDHQKLNARMEEMKSAENASTETRRFQSAVLNGNDDIAQEYILAGADVNQKIYHDHDYRGSRYIPSLFVAIDNCQIETIKMIIDRIQNINSADYRAIVSYILSYDKTRAPEIIKYMCSKGLTIQLQKARHNDAWSVLDEQCLTCRSHDKECVKHVALLVECGMSVKDRPEYLDRAISANNAALIKYLLVECGMSVKDRPEYLDRAISANNAALIEYLREAGCK